MNAKELAVKDIKEELKKYNKCFLAFHSELNNPIRKIIKSYIKKQEEI